jgi:hypothetical protein
MSITGTSTGTNPADVMWYCDLCGRSWAGGSEHACGDRLAFLQPRVERPRVATTRELLALADRYSLDTEQIATFLRLAGEQHPGTIRVADA